MKFKNTFVMGALLIAAAAYAQTQDPNAVNGRRENQQDRVANGVQSGQLTAGETKSLEGREANVNREIRDDRRPMAASSLSRKGNRLTGSNIVSAIRSMRQAQRERGQIWQ